MDIKIVFNKNDNEDNKSVEVKCGKHKIIVSKASQEWNSEGINEFLINVATSIDDNDIFKLIHDDNEKDEMYKYVCNLFENFINEYNKDILTENNSIDKSS